MSGEHCPYCRADVAAGERAAHDAACTARRWWIENYGGPRGAPKLIAAQELVHCQFCGYGFERADLGRHAGLCGQRRWMQLNFEGEGDSPRRPRLVPPDRREDRGIVATVVRRIAGTDSRYERLAWIYESLNRVRDQDTYDRAYPGAMAAGRIWELLVPGRTPEVRALARAALPLVLGTGERLSAAAEMIELDLDRFHAIAPAKVMRQIAHLEDQGADPLELEKKRRLLTVVDELESDLAARKERLSDIAQHLVEMQRELARAIDRRAGAAAVSELAAGVALLENRLAQPLPKRASPRRRPRPRPVPCVVPLPASAIIVAGTPAEAPPIPLPQDAMMAPTAGSRSIAIDQVTFDRLIPETLSFGKTKLIGEYRIIGLLGAGGMGVVFEARSPAGRRVALKTARLGDAGRAESERRMRRFERECRILQSLDHPGCVKLLDMGEEKGELFIVLELVEGVSLAALLAERALTLEETIGLGIELAHSLDYLHEQGVIHRDLKPSNVLIRRDGRPVIADFGISRVLDDTRITNTEQLVGTPGYVAPEVVLGGNLTPAADQWSLGRILLRCGSGAAAEAFESADSFETRMKKGALVDWRELPAAREWIPLGRVLERMLHEQPAHRFGSLAEVEGALLDLERTPELPAGAM